MREVYQFVTFSEGKRNRKTDRPLLIMRHDMDMDLGPAQMMSSLERELGIQANYFFMVRNPLYNVFSGSSSKIVRQILADGHHLGLHFNCALYPDISVNNINHYIAKECSLLEGFFIRPVEAISFHRPGLLELSGAELEKWPHTYEKVFVESFQYFSDSRGIWSHGNPIESEAFSRKKNLHILVHPVWWTSSPMRLYEKLVSIVQQNKQQDEQWISENCQVWNER